MNKQDATPLRSYPAASHANHSVLPGSEAARLMTVTSGRKCLESYNSSSPLGLLVKMCLESSLWHSTRCFLTWKRRDMKPNVSLFRLAVSGPHTVGSAVQLSDGEKNRNLTAQQDVVGNGTGGFDFTIGANSTVTGLYDEKMPTTDGLADSIRDIIPGANTDNQSFRLQRGGSAPLLDTYIMGKSTQEVPQPVTRASGTYATGQNWVYEPRVDRVVYGVPNRMDRIKCLGNAVVPQQFYPIFRAIADIEAMINNT